MLISEGKHGLGSRGMSGSGSGRQAPEGTHRAAGGALGRSTYGEPAGCLCGLGGASRGLSVVSPRDLRLDGSVGAAPRVHDATHGVSPGCDDETLRREALLIDYEL